jgi:hypothetical protein
MRWASFVKRRVKINTDNNDHYNLEVNMISMSTQLYETLGDNDVARMMQTTATPNNHWMNPFHRSGVSSYATGGSNCSLDVDGEFCRFKVAVDVYAVLLLCLFGIAANILSIIILGRDQSVRGTTRYLLQMLAVSDALYLLACLGYQTLGTLEECTTWGFWALNDVWIHAKSPVYTWASVTQTVAVWTVVIVTADRYVAITRPLQAPRYSTMTYARRAVIVAWLLAVVYNMPRLFERYVVEVKDTFPSFNNSNSDTLASSSTVTSCKVCTLLVLLAVDHTAACR